MPTWNWNLTLPLIQNKYGIGGIVDSVTIFAKGDSLVLQFGGDLPKDSIGSDYLRVPGTDPISATAPVSIPDVSSFLPDIDYSPPTVPFALPVSGPAVMLGSAWNTLTATMGSTIASTFPVELATVDLSDAFKDIEFVDPQGVIIGGDSSANHFRSVITVKDFPAGTGVKTASIGMRSSASPDGYLGKLHQRSDLVDGVSYDTSYSIVGDTIGTGTIAIDFSLEFVSLASDDTVTIDDGKTPTIELLLEMKLANPDTALVMISEYVFPTDLEPISFAGMSAGSEDCAVIALYGGTFESKTNDNDLASVNRFNFSNISSTFPFPVDFKIHFKNFFPSAGADSVKFEQQLEKGGGPYSDEVQIYGYQFAHATNPGDSSVKELVIDVVPKTVAGLSKFPIDGSESNWEFTFGVEVGNMWFSTLDAKIDCPFPTQTQAISGMPQGFSGMSFSEVILQFTMINQIRAPIFLDLDIKGVSALGDTVTVPVKAEIETPDTKGDSAKTVIQLSSIGTTVHKYKTFASTTPVTTVDSAGVGENTIVDLLALGPAEIIVDATSGIDGKEKAQLDLDAEIGGTFELIAPFKIIMDPMTFVPEKATDFEEISHETRSMLRSSLKATTLITHVRNGLPTGGEISILFSNLNLFPLDREASTLSFFSDSLKASAEKFVSGDTQSFTSFGFGSGKNRLANLYQNMESLRVVTSCSDLNMAVGDINIFDVLPDTADCKDNTAYLVAAFTDTTERVISYVDTFFQVLLPTPESYFTDTSTVGIPGAVEQVGDTIFFSELDSNNIFHLTDLGSHFVNNRTHFFGTDGKSVFFTLKDTLEIEAMISFTLESTGLLEKAKNEIVITYPNGGETFSIDDTVTIKWRSLGSVKNSSVEVFSATDTSSGGPSEWTSISGGSITNVDSLNWIPGSAYDVIIFRVCSEDGSTCDESGSYSTVVFGRLAAQRSTAKRSKNRNYNGKIR